MIIKKQEGKYSLLIINNVKCKITSRVFTGIFLNISFVSNFFNENGFIFPLRSYLDTYQTI